MKELRGTRAVLRAIVALAAASWSIASAAQQVSIRVDLEPARRLTALACSNQPVNEARFRADPLLAAQLAHHSRFGEQYTIETYLAGLRAIARCETPSPDPFRFASLVEHRERMTKAIAFLGEREQEIGKLAADRIKPYVPADFVFSGAVVPVAASFSCGGFARDGAFFIDVPCVAEDIEGEYDAIARVVAHETYHRIQAQLRGDGPRPIARYPTGFARFSAAC